MIRASRIASALGVPLVGADMNVKAPRSIASTEPGALVFLGRKDPAAIHRLNEIADVACITTEEIATGLNCTVLLHGNPRLAFCRALGAFFPEPESVGGDGSPTISATAVLGEGVRIDAGVRIGERVSIGQGSRIGANVVILAGARVGDHCIVKPNATIGARGFGFARDADGSPVSFPHVGTVRIGTGVEIGANCTVVRAALDVTVIEDHVKTDDHVHIAHNCRIGARTFIAAGAVVSGSVDIGCDVWIGPNATIIDNISIGNGARIGLGSVVMRPVDPGVTVLGNPARRVPVSGR